MQTMFYEILHAPHKSSSELLSSQCVEDSLTSYLDTSARKMGHVPCTGYAQLFQLPSAVSSMGPHEKGIARTNL